MLFTRIGNLALRRRRLILLTTVAALILAGVLGTGVFSRLKSGGFEDPNAESFRAIEVLEEEFGTGPPDVVLVVSDDGANVDDPAVVAKATALTQDLLANPELDDVTSYWLVGQPDALRATDGESALILARIPGDEDQVDDVVGALGEELRAIDDLEIGIGGQAEVFRAVGENIEGDLQTAESVAIPITLILLIIVFGSIVAALLPLSVGIMAIFGAFLVLWITTGVTDVSIFSINLVTAMGLGLAIDYSLFVVSRFREELARGRTVESAIVRTVETAGRTVAFSALTVAVSLSALLIFPLYFLRSFAYAGIGVIIIAMLVSVVTLPALLAVLGHRVDKWQVRKPRATGDGTHGRWYSLAKWVMRRPAAVAGAVTAVLIFVGLPFLGVQFGVPDDRVLPEGDEAREVSNELREDFDSQESNAFPIVAFTQPTDIDGYASELSALDGVGRVDAATGHYIGGTLVAGPDATTERFAGDDLTWLSVVPTIEPISSEGEDLVADIRAIEPGYEVLVAGSSASFVDSKDAIFARAPIAGALIAIATFILLFLMFGSVVMPIKAIILNTLSLTATFGLMVWIFQDGNGADLLNFTPTGLTDTTTPILMFCIAFGLSMDYEVFLLSRIKEEYDRTGDNEEAVAVGLEKTGGIVTAAALLLSVTFFAFATSGVTFIKLFGLGLGIAVLVDASIVRGTLVPALMKLAGSANWWAPAWMKRIYDRFGISEAGPDDEFEPPTDDVDGGDRVLVGAGA